MDMGATQPDPGPGDPGADHYRLGMVRNVTQMGEGWVIGFTRHIPVVRQRNI